MPIERDMAPSILVLSREMIDHKLLPLLLPSIVDVHIGYIRLDMLPAYIVVAVVGLRLVMMMTMKLNDVDEHENLRHLMLELMLKC